MRKNPPVYEVFAKFSIVYFSPSGRELKFICPFHEHKHHQHNASINLDTGKWLCYNGNCGSQGSTIISFIAKLTESSPYRVREFLKKTYDYDETEAVFDDSEDEPDPIRRIAMRLPSTYRPIPYNHPYIKDEGFSYETLQQLDVGIDVEEENGKFKYPDSFILPYYYNGYCVGWARKYIDAKYMYNFQKKLYLYAYDIAKKRSDVVIVEGPRDVWRLRGYGANAVSLSGSSPSPEQLELVFKTWKHITLCFDGDEAGQGATKKFLDHMSGLADIKVITLPEEIDPCDLLTKAEWQWYLDRQNNDTGY